MEGGESFAYAKDSNENLFTFAIGVTKNSNKQISVKRVITEIQRCYDEGKPLGEYKLITGENNE